MPLPLHECGLNDWLIAVSFQKLHELGQAGFFGLGQVVLYVAAEIGLAEGFIKIGMSGNGISESIQTLFFGGAEFIAKSRVVMAAAQRPDGLNKGQAGQFVPGFA